MLNTFFNEMGFVTSHPSADAFVPEYPCVGPSSCAHDLLTDSPQITPDIACTSWIPGENTLGLSGIRGPESLWSADRPACPAPTSISDQTDIQLFSPSFLHQPPAPNSVLRCWQPPPLHHPSARGELDSVWESLIPLSVHATTPPESPARKPTARSLSKRVSASQPLAQPTAPRSYAPYPLGPDSTRRSDLSASFYRCQWFDGARQCDTIVQGTKSAIGHHLQAAHAIRLKGDKTTQVCLWENCRKPMRGESIPRHVIAVHMQDKVPCPSCGSGFSRTDSMQRHQRTCLAKGEDASEACKWESDLAYR